jgi:hypothetical protein
MRRRFGLGLAIGIVLSLATASSAWAQGAVLTLSQSTVTPGGTVTVSGFGFTIGTGGGNIRLDTRDAESLKSFSGDSRGRFVESVPIPANTPLGNHLLIATQVTATGRQRAFTPGRAKLRVVAASAASAAPGGSPGEGSPMAPIAAIIALVLAATMTLTVRRLRTLNRTPLAR